jgi:hypothetical protein
MYRVSYYLTGGTRVSKLFETVHHALKFSFTLGTEEFFQLTKVEE